MRSLERFAQLAQTARREPVPAIDVTARVMRELASPPAPRGDNVPLWIMAGISVLAAAATVAVVFDSWLTLMDPLGGLFHSVTVVML